jgi:electron transport complex protein RnfG
MVVAIVIFATAACTGLAFVYMSTKDRIDENKTAKFNAALKEIFPSAESFEEVQLVETNDNPAVTMKSAAHRAVSGGKTLGIAINVSDMGFSDTIEALVGISSDNIVTGVRILKNTDTPGLGANASSDTYFIDKNTKTKTFYGQFSGMKAGAPIKVTKDGGDVAAITAATITSRAVSLLVETAARAGEAYFSQTQNGGKN